jgi:hypothetical protein
MLKADLHVIATMRAKIGYEMAKGPNGKITPQKVGLEPVQRNDIEYEFDVVAFVDADAVFTVDKSRCPNMQGYSQRHAGEDVGEILRGWLSEGVEEAESTRKRVGRNDVESEADRRTREKLVRRNEMCEKINEVAKGTPYGDALSTAITVAARSLPPTAALREALVFAGQSIGSGALQVHELREHPRLAMLRATDEWSQVYNELEPQGSEVEVDESTPAENEDRRGALTAEEKGKPNWKKRVDELNRTRGKGSRFD